MTEIRTKDKLFLAVVVPLAVVACYWYGWRAEAGRRLDALERRHAALVTEADFAFEMATARRNLTAAEAELEAVRKLPPPEAKVKARCESGTAERERAVLNVLNGAGLFVATVQNAQTESNIRFDEIAASTLESARKFVGGDILTATGVCPNPILRTYVVEGRYPQVVKALEAFASRQMAVIPEKVNLNESERGRWTLTLWL